MKILFIIVAVVGGLTWLIGARRMGRLLGIPQSWMDRRSAWIAAAAAVVALLLLAVLAHGPV